MDRRNKSRVFINSSCIVLAFVFLFLIKLLFFPNISWQSKISELIPLFEIAIGLIIFAGWTADEIIHYSGIVQKGVSENNHMGTHGKSAFRQKFENISLVFFCLWSSVAIYIVIKKYAPEETILSSASELIPATKLNNDTHNSGS